MKKVTLIFAFISALSLTNCESAGEAAEPAILNDITLKSGQAFGFCIGKCYKEIIIKGSAIELLVVERLGRDGVLHKEPKEYRYTDTLSDADLKAIVTQLNLSKISTLDEVYGCPDCADGGSEWLEVTQKNDIKDRVTYEFGQDVKAIEGLTKVLREQRQKMIEKFDKD